MRILINGASSGLGKFLAEYYSSVGNDLFCVGKNRLKILNLKKNISGKDYFFFCNFLNY